MKKIIIAIIIVSALAVGGFLLYRSVIPKIIARAFVSETIPGYIPKRLQNKVEAIRTPINAGTEAMLRKMHASEIPVDVILEAVENISEKDVYGFLDEVNTIQPTTTNEFFEIVKTHFATDFDLELFREPFNKHFEMKQINEAIAYANFNRKSNDVDVVTAKAILKQIIREKEKEVLSSQ